MKARRPMTLGVGLLLVVLGGLASRAVAESSQAASASADVFVLKGVVADLKGPLRNMVVIVRPIDEKTGEALTRFGIVNGQPGPMTNPRTTTDVKGAFSLEVPRSLFKETPGCAVGCQTYKAGELSLGVFQDVGGGSYRSTLKAAVVKYDEKAATVDVGKLVLEPLR